MYFVLRFLLFVSLWQRVQFVYCKEIEKNDDELIFAQTLCRHGDRSIMKSYPTSPFKNIEEFWPEGLSSLTDVGRDQHYMLGEYLRRRYTKLISNGGSLSNTIRVQSTDTERTLSSVEANLAGFLSFANYRLFNRFIDLQPIPVQAFVAEDDYLLGATKQCDRFDYEMVKYFNENDNYVRFWRYFRPLVVYLEENSGITVNAIMDLLYLYDTLCVERLKFNSVSEWAESVMIPGGNDDLELITIFYLQLHTSTIEMKKLKGGYLLKEIFDRFLNKTQSILPPKLSLFMYFGHDVTMVNVLNSLRMFEVHYPPYASCLFFELYQSEGDHYVQMFYKNSTSTDIPAMNIPNCGTKCPLQKMYELYKDVLPERSFDDECALRDGEVLLPDSNPENYVL